MKKRVVAMVVAMIMLVALMPMTAMAAPPDKTLTIVVKTDGVVSSDGGTVTPTSGSTHKHNTWVKLSASANSGYAFTGWSGDVRKWNGDYYVKMSSNKTVTANFEASGPLQYELTIDKRGNGDGTVTKNPDQSKYDPGTVVNLSAVPNATSTFRGFFTNKNHHGYSGKLDPEQVTMDSDKKIYAVFDRIPQRYLSVWVWKDGTLQPHSVSFGVEGWYLRGETVDLPDLDSPWDHYRFAGWRDCHDNTITSVKMDSGKIIHAVFEKEVYTVTIKDKNGNELATEQVAYLEDVQTTPGDITLPAGVRFASPAWDISEGQGITENTIIVANTEYKVTFDPNGGTFDAGDGTQWVAWGGDAAPPSVMGPTGYDFASPAWQPLYANVTLPTTCVAQWEKEEYTVTYDAGSVGRFTSATTNTTEQVLFEEYPANVPDSYYWNKSVDPAIIVPYEYEFLGWSSDGGTTILTKAEVEATQITGHTTYVAQFEHIGSFDLEIVIETNGAVSSDGGLVTTNINPTTSVPYPKSIKLTPTANPGYQFAGFTADGRLKNWSPIWVKMNADKTVIAHFVSNTYTVTYDKNGGTGTQMADSAHVYGIDQNLTANSYTREGYTFLGWSTTLDGAVEYTDGQSVKNLTTSDGGNVILYAVWEANTYTVTYDINSGDGGSTAPSSHVYGTPSLLTSNGFTKTGYTFLGWARSATGPREFDDGESVLNLTPDDGDIIELFAVWEAIDYTLTINYLDRSGNPVEPAYTGTFIIGDPYSVSSPAVLGYEAPSIATVSGTIPDNDVTVNVYYDNHTFVLAYVKGGDDVPADLREYSVYHRDSQTGAYPVELGYKIEGSGNSVVSLGNIEAGNTRTNRFYFTTNSIGLESKEKVILYWYDEDNGEWIEAKRKNSAKLYQVMFDANSGAFADTSTLKIDYAYKNKYVTSPDLPTKTGYTFLGWDINDDGVIDASDDLNSDGIYDGTDIDKMKVKKSTTIKALWEAIDYTLTINYLDRATNNPVYTVYTGTYNYGDPYSEASPAMLGYEAPSIATVAGTMPDDDVTVNVYYDTHSFTLTYMAGTDDEPTDLREYRIFHDDTVTDSYPVTMGYMISGSGNSITTIGDIQAINTSANRFTQPFLFETNPIGVGSSETCIVYWYDEDNDEWIQADTKAAGTLYQVTFDANSGAFADTSVLKYDYAYVNGSVSSPIIPTKTGYTFLGWDINGDGVIDASDDLNSDNVYDGADIDELKVKASITIKALWEADDQTLIFMDGFGSEISNSQVPTDGAITYPADPTKPGYTFTGWDSSETTMPPNALTITAQWEVIDQTLIFMDGFGGEISNMQVPTDGAITYPADPTKDGYIFTGWDSSESTMPPNALTITAQWEVIDQTLIFMDGFGGEISNTQVPTDGAITYPADPTKPGYTFTGWDSSETTMPPNALTITAQWEVIDQTLIIMDGFGGEISNTQVPTDGAITYPADPTKPGYTFTGWDSSETTMPPNALTITAQWEAIDYTVTYVGGDGVTDVPTDSGVYNIGNTVDVAAQGTMAKEGYTFVGWSDGATTYTGDGTETFAMPASDVTLTAQWEINTYTVSFFEQDGVTQIGTTQVIDWDTAAVFETAPAITGYAFDAWVLTGNDDTETDSLLNVCENITAVASYVRNGYTVTFEDYDGTMLGTDGVLYGGAAIPPVTPEREGYTFVGWSESLDPITGNITVTAQYEMNTFTVQFMDHDGSVIDTQTVDWNTSATAPADPEREGYTFIGWDKAFDAVTEGLTVTAQYKKVDNIDDENIPKTEDAEITDEEVPLATTPQSGFPWWWILIGVGGIAILFLLFFFWKRRKKDEQQA